ncbi:MAG: phage tail assembly protein, partial [Desulfovibrio sp.]|nr:phage tail assembly protein [Desulfovibrio sp.]
MSRRFRMAQTKTVKLAEPIMVGGKEVTEVTLRRSTVGDEEDAMQQAVQLKRGKNP